MHGKAIEATPVPAPAPRTGDAAGRQLGLSALPAPPHRADPMNDVSSGKAIGLGHHRVARLAATEQPAFMHEVQAGGAMYGAIAPAAAKQ